MERWQGKLAVITGAASGIGAAITTILVENGMIVLGIDILESRLQELGNILKNKKGKFHFHKADVRNEEEIIKTFSYIEKNFGGIHVFVNNAGLLGKIKPIEEENETEHWKQVLDINILALTICSREALKSMRKHKIDDGNIINLASMAAYMSSPFPGYTMYCASKKAVQAITEGMRIELALTNSKIKITTICPGIVNTELYVKGGVSIKSGTPVLLPENVAQGVVCCLQMPLNAQITDLHIQATGENLNPTVLD